MHYENMTRRRVLCFGDSNTYGYDPARDGRYGEDERYPMVLQDLLGDGWSVVEEGLPGRTAVFDDPITEGMNGLQVFIRIVLPLVSPGIVATAIYVFINAWNEYLYSMILMSSSDKTTISVAVKTLEGADILNWGSLMAACAIVVVPSIIFFCFIQNKMAGGLSDGAVK